MADIASIKNVKLTKKITIIVSAVLIAGFAALTVILSLHEKQVLMNELDKKGDNMVKFVAEISVGPILSYNFTYLENYVKVISRGDRDIAYAVILDRNGHALTHLKGRGDGGNDIRVFTSPIFQDKERIGTVKIGYSTASIGKALFSSQAIIAALSVCTLLIIALTIFMTFRITTLKPIEKLKGTMEKVAAGDLTATAEIKTGDEIGTLGRNINHMIDSLAGLIGHIKSSSGSIAFASDRISATSGNITSASDRTASTAGQAAKDNEMAATAVEETSATMHEMSANIQGVARNCTAQASFVAETSSSIEQMAASINAVAATVEGLIQLSAKSKQAVTLGLDSVTESMKGTDEISTAIHRSADTISALGSRAEDIGKIVDVIDGIAEQTNLLALNAAIEAARAGEQGLGFAVVAEEVKKLAERSASSTNEIAELIRGIQQEAAGAVSHMERAIETVEKGVEASRHAFSALTDINANVEELNNFAENIGAATKKQNEGGAQISKSATRLKEIIEDITSSMAQQSAAAEQTVQTMDRLRETLHQNASGTADLATSAEELRSLAAAELAASVEQLRSEAAKFMGIVGMFDLGDVATSVPGDAGKASVDSGGHEVLLAGTA